MRRVVRGFFGSASACRRPAGGLGHLGVQWARAMGFETVATVAGLGPEGELVVWETPWTTAGALPDGVDCLVGPSRPAGACVDRARHGT